ncbi:MAG TPA: hypothetical protein VER58_22100 [Thermoanaerobaculia bacterium]|nr:hypothetical protein [Thermoanaerobaculia bacterium]
MTERELIDRFESCAVPNEGLHHRDHVHVVWAYLREMPVVEALSRFSTSLKRFASHYGKTMLYHETITWAYVALIHERMQQRPDADWDAFCRLNPDLLKWKPSILDQYYRPETLASDLARRVFILPDRR